MTTAALEVVKTHRLGFWDAMLWALAVRAGVRHLLTKDLQNGFALQGVTFVNPFERTIRAMRINAETWLLDAEDFAGLCLRQPALLDDLIDL